MQHQSKTIGNRTAESLLREMRDELVRPKPVLPPGGGWVLYQELRSATGFSKPHFTALISQKEKEGIYERFQGRTITKDGRSVNTTWLRKKQSGKTPDKAH